jgi:hypothetical protein
MLGNIVGHIVNFVAVIPHLLILLFHNLILLVFILGFFYGIFKLFKNGWRKLRGRAESKNGGD